MFLIFDENNYDLIITTLNQYTRDTSTTRYKFVANQLKLLIVKSSPNFDLSNKRNR